MKERRQHGTTLALMTLALLLAGQSEAHKSCGDPSRIAKGFQSGVEKKVSSFLSDMGIDLNPAQAKELESLLDRGQTAGIAPQDLEKLIADWVVGDESMDFANLVGLLTSKIDAKAPALASMGNASSGAPASRSTAEPLRIPAFSKSWEEAARWDESYWQRVRGTLAKDLSPEDLAELEPKVKGSLVHKMFHVLHPEQREALVTRFSRPSSEALPDGVRRQRTSFFPDDESFLATLKSLSGKSFDKYPLKPDRIPGRAHATVRLVRSTDANGAVTYRPVPPGTKVPHDEAKDVIEVDVVICKDIDGCSPRTGKKGFNFNQIITMFPQCGPGVTKLDAAGLASGDNWQFFLVGACK